MEIKDIQDAVVTVMGLGRLKKGSGVGATKWLLRHGAQVVITDFRSEDELRESIGEVMSWFESYRVQFPERDLYHPIFVLGEHRDEDFTDVDLVVINPDISHASPYVKMAHEHNIPVESDMSLFFRFCPFPVVGCTAARGKTFMTALLGEILKTRYPGVIVAGNMRVSPLEHLDDLLAMKEPVPIVLEFSSWLLESLNHLDRGPAVGVFSNIHGDHLHRYDSLQAYVDSKENILTKSGPDGVAILNRDQQELVALSERAPGKVVWVSLKPALDGEAVFVEGGQVISTVGGISPETVMAVSDVHMEGEDNLHNILSAIAVAKLHGVKSDAILQVVSTFSTDDDRQEIVTDVSGVIYVNDALGSSADATTKILRRFGERGRSIHLISGGDIIGGDLSELARVIHLTCKEVILLMGAGSSQIERAVGGDKDVVIRQAVSIQDAVNMAAKDATSGYGVIFSPALGYSDESVARTLGDEFAAAARGLK